MSISDPGDAERRVAKAVVHLVAAVTAEAAIVVGHFLYSAKLYEDPQRAHPVEPVLVALALTVGLSITFWRTEKNWALGLLTVTAGVPFVLVFGGYHGGVSHLLKLVMFAIGTSPERLEAMFDSPDFAVPNDVAFEASGVLCLAAAAVVTWTLVSLVRAATARRASSHAPVVQDA